MLVRFVLFVLGAASLAGGGWLGWLKRNAAGQLFPPPAGVDVWLLIAALALLCAGLVLIAAALIPRPERAAQRAAEAERRQKAMAEADSFYAQRARAADSDWRTGDLPAPPSLAPTPEQPVAPSAPDRPDVKPASAAPSDPPPPDNALSSSPTAALPQHDQIRLLIDQGRLEEAEVELDRVRASLTANAQPPGLELAELTGLAGDHASAAGRLGNAKWLWRLALKRFGEAGAAQSPAARHVAEQLRRADPQ